MKSSDYRDLVDNIVSRSIDRLRKVYNNETDGKKNTRLIFPNKRGGEASDLRVSEQELRFVFVEVFNEICTEENLDLHYAVEVPTQDTYYFKDKKPRTDPNGQSAMFDLAIYDKDRRLQVFIEFKANNPGIRDYEKDFVKLQNPEENNNGECLCCFIELLRNADGRTIESLRKKCRVCPNIYFRCISLIPNQELDKLNEELDKLKS